MSHLCEKESICDWVCLWIPLVLILSGAIVVKVTAHPREALLVNVSWTFEGDVGEVRAVHRDGWFLPFIAQVLTQEERQTSTQSVVDHTEQWCWSENVCGQRNVFREEPVMTTYYTYVMNEYVVTRHVSLDKVVLNSHILCCEYIKTSDPVRDYTGTSFIDARWRRHFPPVTRSRCIS